jgi:hypothetical protein
MKLKLSFSLILSLLFLLPNKSNSQILDVPQKDQEESQWCWAATSQAVLEYYDTIKTQSEIAEYGTNGENIWNWLYGSSSDPVRRGVNLILNHFGNISSETYGTSLTLNNVEDEIGNKRPIPFRWLWDGGGGHILLIHGIIDSLVYLMDPFYSPTINSYNWVLEGSSHTWTHSLKLLTTPSSVYDTSDNITGNTLFLKNYPNPFDKITYIKFHLLKKEKVSLNIFNVHGQKIETLVDQELNAGEYKYKWNAAKHPSGIYLYRLNTPEFSSFGKMVLLK